MPERHRWDPVVGAVPPLVRPVRVDPAGRTGPTRGQAVGPRWRRTSRGLYVPATVAPDVLKQRVLEQSVRVPTGGAVTGWAALRLHGAAFFDGLARDGRSPLPVPVAIRSRNNIRADGALTVLRTSRRWSPSTWRARARSRR